MEGSGPDATDEKDFCYCDLYPSGIPLHSFDPAGSTAFHWSGKVGSAVYVKKRAFEEISEGDVITFLTEHGNMRVTHRVTEVDEKKKTFATKGDANEYADRQMVKWENVCGVVIYSLPKAGYVQDFLGKRYGKLTAAAVLAGLFLLTELLENENTKKETS